MTSQFQPAFFGPGGELFGCLHRPTVAQSRVGALFCYPAFGEYIQHHRAYMQLATRLACGGIPSLRFDYFGTGDSAGDLSEATLGRWREDIALATSYFSSHCNVESIAVIGARLGATLAAFAAAADPLLGQVVLWEPVVNGTDYLAELRAAHIGNLSRYGPAAGDPEMESDGVHDLLGFEIPHALWNEIRELHLSRADLSPGVEVLVIGSEAHRETVRESLASNLTRVWFERSESLPGWLAPEDGIYDVLTPQQTLTAVTQWLNARIR